MNTVTTILKNTEAEAVIVQAESAIKTIAYFAEKLIPKRVSSHDIVIFPFK